MEVRVLDDFNMIKDYDGVVELKVRAADDDFDYYLFPRTAINKVLVLLKNAGIRYDAVPADSGCFKTLPVQESKYSDVEEYDTAECVALHTVIAIDELYEIMAYVEAHASHMIKITIYRNSELPEFQNILTDSAKEELSEEIQIVFCEYMKLLMDLSDAERLGKIIDYSEQGSFAHLLKKYSPNIVEFILTRVTKRLETELRSEME